MNPLFDNIVAWYKMGDNAENTIVLDSSGNNYHGTSVRNTNLMHTNGKVGGALEFNGTSDYVDTGQTFANILSDNWSVSVWVKASDGINADFQTILGVTNPSEPAETLFIAITDIGALLSLYEAGLDITDNIVLNVFVNGENPWTMITVTMIQKTETHTEIKTYINGILRQTDYDYCLLQDFASAEQNVFIGAHNYKGIIESFFYPFTGSLDNAMIFNKALSPSEVLYLYNNGNGRETFEDRFSTVDLDKEYWGW